MGCSEILACLGCAVMQTAEPIVERWIVLGEIYIVMAVGPVELGVPPELKRHHDETKQNRVRGRDQLRKQAISITLPRVTFAKRPDKGFALRPQQIVPELIAEKKCPGFLGLPVGFAFFNRP